MGASLSFTSDLKLATIVITVCNKDRDLNYTFPELKSIDVKEAYDSQWNTIWNASFSSVTLETFLSNILNDDLRLCKTMHVYETSPSELRIRHYYSSDSRNPCKLNKIAVYLHTKGAFLSKDFLVPFSKKLFEANENYVLELNLENIVSLPTAEFTCNHDETAQTFDGCFMDKAVYLTNQSTGCISRYMR
jgi:hypothetical protein